MAKKSARRTTSRASGEKPTHSPRSTHSRSLPPVPIHSPLSAGREASSLGPDWASTTEMQPRQGGPSGGGVPRRSLMNPFVAQSTPYQQQQQPSGFLQYPGVSVPMPSVDSSTRSFGQQQQTAAQQIPGRYWQSPTGLEASAFGKQSPQGGNLDLEFSDILSNSAGSTRSGTESSETQDMGMSGFDVNSFQDGMASSSGEKANFHSGSSPAAPLQALSQSRPSISSSSLKVGKKSGADASDPEATSHLVDAAYARFADPQGDPDLTQRKIEDKNERCEFLSCPNRARVAQAYGKFCNRHVIVSPCGFPGCRDKAIPQAVMCEKHLELGKDALYKILANRPQNVPVCRQFGCFKNDQGRGYCRGHEKLLMATGRLPPHINKRRLNSAYTMCSYPECNKHSQRHHLCRTHGNLIKTQAQELADRPGATESYEEVLDRLQKDIRRCTHENCTKNSQRDRLCTLHYYEKHNLQKDGSSSAPTSESEDKFQATPSGTESIAGIDDRAVERTQCTSPGCGNLSYAAGLCVEHVKLSQSELHFGDSFHSGGNTGTLTVGADIESKQGMFDVNGKLQSSGAADSSNSTMTSSAASSCNNPMCARNSYGREYCEACQRFFAPNMNDMLPGSSSYPLRAQTISNTAQAKGNEMPCRVKNCGLDSVRGGLCNKHFRAFQTGSLSVDQLSLDSQEQQHHREQELAAAAAAAAVAADTKQESPTSGKLRKYFCRVDNCDKQAQKRGLCKRHFRLQEEGIATAKSHTGTADNESAGGFLAPVGQSGFAHAAISCRFPECEESADSDNLLCMFHSKASFCWQPGCENLVGYPKFCEFHDFRKQCAFEGCMYSSENDRSGCAAHKMARRCRHDYCDKFAVGPSSEWCRIHQTSCQESPCALCQLHLLALPGFAVGVNENSNRSRFNMNLSIATTKGLSGSSFDEPRAAADVDICTQRF